MPPPRDPFATDPRAAPALEYVLKRANNVRRYFTRLLEFQDVRQAARIGLWRALLRYPDLPLVPFQKVAWRAAWSAIVDESRRADPGGYNWTRKQHDTRPHAADVQAAVASEVVLRMAFGDGDSIEAVSPWLDPEQQAIAAEEERARAHLVIERLAPLPPKARLGVELTLRGVPQVEVARRLRVTPARVSQYCAAFCGVVRQRQRPKRPRHKLPG